MKKFFAKLMGWHEQQSGAERFHQQEEIERDLAKERAAEAKKREHERLRQQMDGEEVQIPSDSEILGPSDSMEKKED